MTQCTRLGAGLQSPDWTKFDEMPAGIPSAATAAPKDGMQFCDDVNEVVTWI